MKPLDGEKMARKRAGVQKKETARTILAMATEMAEMRCAMERSYILFAALAASVGVMMQSDNVSGN